MTQNIVFTLPNKSMADFRMNTFTFLMKIWCYQILTKEYTLFWDNKTVFLIVKWTVCYRSLLYSKYNCSSISTSLSVNHFELITPYCVWKQSCVRCTFSNYTVPGRVHSHMFRKETPQSRHQDYYSVVDCCNLLSVDLVRWTRGHSPCTFALTAAAAVAERWTSAHQRYCPIIHHSRSGYPGLSVCLDCPGSVRMQWPLHSAVVM